MAGGYMVNIINNMLIIAITIMQPVEDILLRETETSDSRW